MSNKINILIPNATGPKNPGDQAILAGLLNILGDMKQNFNITMLSTNPELYPKKFPAKIDISIYEWTMSDELKFATKLSRSLLVILGYILLKLNLEFLITSQTLKKIIQHYSQADLIIYVGGGSLRSRPGLKNAYILFIILMIYLYANHFKTKKILTPISYGPFPYSWQYKLVAKALEKTDVVSFREKFSQQMFEKYSKKKSILSSDSALLLRKSKILTKGKDFVIGFTIRNWFKDANQEKLEKAYATALYNISRKARVKIQPIIQVNVPGLEEEDDLKAARNVMNRLKNYGIKTNKEIIINDLNSAIKSYGAVDLMLGMRMHSNIIAATQGVPFLAVSYEYKTEGIAYDLGLHDYCIKSEEVNGSNLTNLLIKVYKKRLQIKKILESSLNKIRTNETNKWMEIFNYNLKYA